MAEIAEQIDNNFVGKMKNAIAAHWILVKILRIRTVLKSVARAQAVLCHR
jgi:hypothetical protein